MIREYLKLSRSFNAVLTGVSPVMGAIAMEYYNIPFLFLLFLIGFLGHTYGFILNDIIDYRIDRTSKEISDRPLVSGTISLKQAWIYSIGGMKIAFIIAIYIAITLEIYYSIAILGLSAFFVTLYNLISKRYPFTDIIIAIGVFFLVLYGASIVATINEITRLTWIICVLGGMQVLFMQIVAGGMKDLENDFKRKAKTLIIALGTRIVNGKLIVSNKYKVVAYGIQIIDIVIVFLPFFIIWTWTITSPSLLNYFQWIILGLISIFMIVITYKLISMDKFNRGLVRKLIGTHYIINFALVPIMLMQLNPWTAILMVFPPIGFILSNIILHGTILQPKTM